ncbi:MAG TPA: hypothetical protein VGI71_00450 [Scandinavium sp.]|jgi:DNA-binding response OmpR family regulator
MDKTLFGYCIGADVYVGISGKRIFNVNSKNNSKSVECVTLRDTMLRLVLFLLENANGSITPTKYILSGVWDAYGLSSSGPRLWHVMQQLKIKLNMVGVPDQFIMKVENKGYYLKENMIRKLYVISEENVFE